MKTLKSKRKAKRQITLDDYIKASRSGYHQAEQEIKGPGFHSTHHIHRSAKTYTRKSKHKNAWEQ